MSKTSIYSLLLLSALWILGGRWYYMCSIKKNCCNSTSIIGSTTIAGASALNLMDGADTLMSNFNHFVYPDGAIEPNLNSNNNLFLDSLATWLKANPEKHLTITGIYTQSEKEPETGFYENMGMARADAIRAMLTKRGITEERISMSAEVATDNTLNEPLLFDTYTPIKQNDVVAAAGDSSETVIALLDPKKSDPKPKAYNNAGVNAVKKSEVEKPTTSKVPAKTLLKPVADAAAKVRKESFNFFNMTFSDANFEPNSVVFKPSRQFKTYADSVRLYIGLHPTKKITVIGHTDSRGEEAPNWKLGLRRADEVRAYFKKIGIKTPIEVISKGEKNPLANNINEAGRKQNRRINVIIQ